MPFPIGIFSSEIKAEIGIRQLADTYHDGYAPKSMRIISMTLDENWELERINIYE